MSGVCYFFLGFLSGVHDLALLAPLLKNLVSLLPLGSCPVLAGLDFPT